MRELVFRGERIPLGGNLNGGTLGGITYVCPGCGEPWARAYLSPRGPWMASSSPCPDHGDIPRSSNLFGTGGSILWPLIWWDTGTPKTHSQALDTLSPGLLRHEALMLANRLLKGPQ